MSATPEQVIGQALALVLRLKRYGIRVHQRPQALGAATVAALRDAGFTIVDTEHLRIIEDGNDRMDAEIERLRGQLEQLEDRERREYWVVTGDGAERAIRFSIPESDHDSLSRAAYWVGPGYRIQRVAVRWRSSRAETVVLDDDVPAPEVVRP